MKRISMLLSLVVLCALPATAAAHESQGKGKAKGKADSCPVQISKKGNGKAARCERQLKRKVKRAAIKACLTERAADPAAFAAKYGAEGPLRSCVKQQVQEAITEFKNAAEECKTERAADPGKFRADYGTNHNKRNAFGKCVSSHVNDDGEQEAGGVKDGDEAEENDDAGDDDGPGKSDEDHGRDVPDRV